MSESIKNFEKNEPVYPSKEDVIELRRVALTKATGANIHTLGIISNLTGIVSLGKEKGWDEERLRMFHKEKIILYETLLGIKQKID